MAGDDWVNIPCSALTLPITCVYQDVYDFSNYVYSTI